MQNLQTTTNKIFSFAPPCKPSAKYNHVLFTASDEPLVPIRLYYEVAPRRIRGHFNTMSCVEKKDNYYLFFYTAEMLGNELGLLYHQIPPELRPLNFGRASVDYKSGQMIIDVDSYVRANAVIELLNIHTSSKAKALRFVATYNRLIHSPITNVFDDFVHYNNYNRLFAEENLPYTSTIQESLYNNPQQLLLDSPLVEKFAASNINPGLYELQQAFDIKLYMAKCIADGINCKRCEFYEMLEQDLP